MKALHARSIVVLAIMAILWFGFVVYYSKKRGTEGDVVSFSGETMGTTYIVKIRGALPFKDNAATIAAIEAVLTEVNQTFSIWQADSAIRRFNQTETLDWIEVPKPLWQLTTTAKDLWFVTRGRYDVSAGALFALWGFASNEKALPPKKEEIARILKTVGMQYLEIDTSKPALRKLTGDLQLDLSSIAKGYGVDALGRMLEKRGIKHYLIEIGGEIRVRGRKSRQQRWHIAIEKPVDKFRLVEKIVALENQSMATSGNYRNFFEESGERYAHILDVTSGYQAKSRLASVSVFAETTTLADGWATALFASGDLRAKMLARVMDLPVLLILHRENASQESEKFDIWYSPKMEQMIEKQNITVMTTK